MDLELRSAVQAHQCGRLDEAARVYERLIADNPRHAIALGLLGALAHQQGSHDRARGLLQQAIAINPRDPSFHANLAEVFRALGHFEQAIHCCQAALHLEPNSATAINNQGLAQQALGRTEPAIDSFREATKLQPGFALAHNNLGMAMRSIGRGDEALIAFRRAVTLDSNLAMAHSNLGQLLLERYRRKDSLVHCREAVRLQPGLAEAQNNLGNVLREMGRLVEAHVCYAEALRLNPNLALTCNNIGQAFQEEGKLPAALSWYQRALQLDPQSARIHCNVGSLFQELDQIVTSTAHFERALQLDPQLAEALHGLGWIYHDQGKFQDALNLYDKALRSRPDFAVALCSRGTLLQEMGNLGEAQKCFREALRHDPDCPAAHAELATLLRGKLPDEDLTAACQLVTNSNLSEGKRSAIYFGLAHVFDGREDYLTAGEYLAQANRLRHDSDLQRGRGYDPAMHHRLVTGLIETFTPDWFDRVKSFGLDSKRAIFIVGLPRSGTTLTEQILASHSQVFGAGELGLAGRIFESLPARMGLSVPAWDCASHLDQSAATQLAIEFLESLSSIDPASRHVVDKMPDNYLYLGLIAALFPRAKIIHCRRDLRDIAVSCWLTNFRQIRWANHFEHIASRFQQYRRLMDHWKRVLPVSILNVDYEQTVADVEGTARRMLDWCGLEWEPACAAFHENNRPVRTASVTQVRQPIYQRSVSRWMNYEGSLNPLFALLKE